MPDDRGVIVVPESYRGREQAYVKHRLLETYLEKLFLIVGLGAKTLGIKELAYVDCFAGPWGDESESLDSTSIAISLRVQQWGAWGADGEKRSKSANGREYRGQVWDAMPQSL